MNMTLIPDSPLDRVSALWPDSYGDALADLRPSELQMVWFLVRNGEQLVVSRHTLTAGDVMHELVWRGMARRADWALLGRAAPDDCKM